MWFGYLFEYLFGFVYCDFCCSYNYVMLCLRVLFVDYVCIDCLFGRLFLNCAFVSCLLLVFRLFVCGWILIYIAVWVGLLFVMDDFVVGVGLWLLTVCGIVFFC